MPFALTVPFKVAPEVLKLEAAAVVVTGPLEISDNSYPLSKPAVQTCDPVATMNRGASLVARVKVTGVSVAIGISDTVPLAVFATQMSVPSSAIACGPEPTVMGEPICTPVASLNSYN